MPITSPMRSTWRVLEARRRHSIMRPLLNAAPHSPAIAVAQECMGYGGWLAIARQGWTIWKGLLGGVVKNVRKSA